MINFTIDGNGVSNSYQGLTNMTFEDWVNSENNIGFEGFYIKIFSDGTIGIDDGSGIVNQRLTYNSIKVNKTDKLIENANYNLIDN